jgi:hypothetical protein
MTPTQRQSAVDRVRESLVVLVHLARSPEGYTPMDRYIDHTAETLVDAVLALTKPRPAELTVDWPQAFPRPEHETDDEWVARMSAAVERLR